jgi:S-adenosylhomocysteine hydrolase
MPGLMALREGLSGSKTFNSARSIGSLQMTIQTAVPIEVLRDLVDEIKARL